MNRVRRDMCRAFPVSFILFSIPFFLIYTVLGRNPVKGAVLGAAAGMIYATGTLLYSLIQEREAAPLRDRLFRESNVILYATANMLYGREAAGGRLFLTDEEVIFVELGPLGKKRQAAIRYGDITGAGAVRRLNTFEVTASGSEKIRLVTFRREEVIGMIRKMAEDRKGHTA